MREAFSSLTTRGLSFFAAGVVCAIAGLVLGHEDLFRISVLLIALPVTAVLLLSRSRYRLASTRSVTPARIEAGQSANVTLTVENVSRIPTGVMFLEESLPYALGGRPRFIIDRLLPSTSRQVTYPVRSENRGRFRVGPLTIRLSDPLGLCELVRAFNSTDTVLVTPQIVPLAPVRIAGSWNGGGDGRSRSVASSGDDDVATREYRRGDDLRRVHWRSTARAGELMVRREEQPWQSRAVLLLDCRGTVHHGDGPASSLEWAISAAASVGLHLSRAGFTMRVVTDSGDEVSSSGVGADAFDSVLLDNLAVRTASVATGLRAGVTAIRRGGGEELLVAVVGPLSSEDAQTLSRAAHGGLSVGVALVLDTASWTTLAPRAAAAAQEAHQATCDILAAAGWRVLPVTAGASLAELWPASGSGLAAAAGREVGRRTAATGTGP
jgi:uncharacterized protein (DUF58 family)